MVLFCLLWRRLVALCPNLEMHEATICLLALLNFEFLNKDASLNGLNGLLGTHLRMQLTHPSSITIHNYFMLVVNSDGFVSQVFSAINWPYPPLCRPSAYVTPLPYISHTFQDIDPGLNSLHSCQCRAFVQHPWWVCLCYCSIHFLHISILLGSKRKKPSSPVAIIRYDLYQGQICWPIF